MWNVSKLILGLCVWASLGSLGFAQEERPSSRWEQDILSFEQQDKSRPPQPGGVVFVGSSSIRLWNLDEAFPATRLVNRGFGGSEMKDSVHFFDRIVLPHRPGLVVLYAGDNDIANKVTPESVHAQFLEFVKKLHAALPNAKLVYVPIKPSVKRWNLIEPQRTANGLIRESAKSDPLVTVLDIEAPMLGSNGEPKPELFVKDGLHLSEAGYAIWNELLQQHLADYSKYAADGLRVYADGIRPDDARLAAQRTLNDKYHPWTPPKDKGGWEQAVEEIRRQLLVSNGLWPMPEKAPLQPVIHGKLDMGDYTVEKVYFATAPGLYLTGSLFRPKNFTGKIPGVLCPHGHWANGRFYDAGDKAAAEQIAAGAEKFNSGAHSPVQARMVHLARMGCTVFHYDMVGYADQPGIDHRGGFNDVNAALWLHSKMGLQTWNSIRALDFLESLPEVDGDRIGVTGASGGGTQTFILGALDPRPDVCFPAVMVGTAMQGGCNCENAHFMRIGINNVAYAAMFAPRPMALSGADDWTIDIETKGLPELKQIYGYYGAADLVHAKCYPQFGHNYNQVSREMMYAWFQQYLGLANAPVIEQEFTPLTQQQLTVFDADHPKPADVLEGPALREELTRQSKAQLAGLTTDKDYREVVGGAAEVMFGNLPTESDVQVQKLSAVKLGPYTVLKGTVGRKSDDSCVPTVVIVHDEKFRGQVEIRLHPNGKSHLFDQQGQPTPSVVESLEQGNAVLSADLFLTGEYLTGENPPTYPVTESDPVYTYCYNRPLLAHRVRDIWNVVAAVRQHPDTKSISLKASEGAGAWALLARAMLPAEAIKLTEVDLAGFSFEQVTSPQDPNLLPGALKYGDVQGLVSLAAGQGAYIEVRGTDPAAWKSTVERFQSAGGTLKVQP